MPKGIKGFQKGHPQYNTGRTHFKKGFTPWIKGKKHSQKTREKMSNNYKYHVSPSCNKKGDWTGEKNPRWKGGFFKDKDGYILVYKPFHPFANITGYIRKHRIVMEKIIGRYLKVEEVVHHINGIRHDNRYCNLKLFKNNSEHRKYPHNHLFM